MSEINYDAITVDEYKKLFKEAEEWCKLREEYLQSLNSEIWEKEFDIEWIDN